MLTITDGGFEARAKVKGKSQNKIDDERMGHVKANHVVLKYFGRAAEDFPSAIVTDGVAIFEDHLEAFLSTNWPEWVTASDEVEAEAGINLSKNQLAYRTATLKANGAVPGMLMQILAKAEGM